MSAQGPTGKVNKERQRVREWVGSGKEAEGVAND